jgi:UDP-GlcNAc:undecaprenyl-phosphate GlcNAc-1-phosphate transferase
MNPWVLFLVSFLISYALTIPTIFLAKKLQLVTDKKLRHHPAHTHRGVIPRGGGVPIYLAIFLTSLIFLPMNKIMIGILISCFLLILIGLYDDYFDSSPYVRFISNILISTMVVLFGLGIPYISNPFGEVIRLDRLVWTINFLGTHKFIILGNLAAILWLTWTTNMVNWSKGVDGQLPGFVTIACIFLGILSQRFSAFDISAQTVGLFSFIIAGAFLGFLPFNFYPQKIMPGYGGGGMAGFLLGVLAILSFGKLGTAVLVLSMPMIDAIYTIVRRLKNKKSPFKADWGHLHHRLLEIGWGRRRIAVFYWIVTLIFGIASLFLEGIEKLASFLTVGIILIVFILIINKLKTV